MDFRCHLCVTALRVHVEDVQWGDNAGSQPAHENNAMKAALVQIGPNILLQFEYSSVGSQNC